MKKIYKVILTAALALMLLLSLSGCSALDEMRSNQAFYLGHGIVSWNGQIYKALPACDYLNPQKYNKRLHLTDEDVPVLLSDVFFQDSLDVSTDKNILRNFADDIYYCKEELYDELSRRVREPFVADMISYEYAVYNEEKAEFEDRYCKLTEQQIAGLEEILKRDPLPDNDIKWEDQYWCIALYEYSDDMLFRKDYMDIYSTGDRYFLLVRPETGAEQLYAVPQKFHGLIQQIAAEFLINNGVYFG